MERFKVYQEQAVFATFFFPLFFCFIFNLESICLCELLCFCSSFADIFDVDHFIDVLHDEVSIVKELPSEFFWSTREYYGTGIRATRIKTAPVQATADWYIENVLPVLQRYANCLSSNLAMVFLFLFFPNELEFYNYSHCFTWIIIDFYPCQYK